MLSAGCWVLSALSSGLPRACQGCANVASRLSATGLPASDHAEVGAPGSDRAVCCKVRQEEEEEEVEEGEEEEEEERALHSLTGRREDGPFRPAAGKASKPASKREEWPPARSGHARREGKAGEVVAGEERSGGRLKKKKSKSRKKDREREKRVGGEKKERRSKEKNFFANANAIIQGT